MNLAVNVITVKKNQKFLIARFKFNNTIQSFRVMFSFVYFLFFTSYDTNIYWL